MPLPDDFIFSQSSLQDYVDCPRRFELKYLLRQRWPAPEVDDLLEFERRMEQGQHFHHLVHQHLIGIPETLLTKHLDDPDIQRWFGAYLKNGLDDVPAKRYPEHTLIVTLGNYQLLAKFDLLALGEKAIIIDWKTSRYLPKREQLSQRLQTIVYRYVLARGGAHLNGNRPIAPDQIEMVYWYAEHDGTTRRFEYDGHQFDADNAYLTGLIDEILARSTFPLTEETRRCRFCTYRSLCERGIEAGSLAEWETEDYDAMDLDDFEIDLDQIGEIVF